ncbi:MAG: hypothetical protein M3P70_18280 [Actinomycetota bacterium]|nr:hypothetical protein [Actinomycetota bacterium]
MAESTPATWTRAKPLPLLPLPKQERDGVPLPIPPSPLVGWERDLVEVVALLGRPDLRLLTLTGADGTGKAPLAPRGAAARRPGRGFRFVGPRWLVMPA